MYQVPFLVFIFLIFSSIVAVDAFGETSYETLQFGHESRLSIINSGGNSDLQTYNLQTKNQARFGANKLQLNGHYTYGKSQNIESARNWSALGRYDRFVSDDFSVFLAEEVEGDKFQGLDYRYNTDIGVSYQLFKTDRRSFLSEVGYRYTYEKSIDETIGSENLQKGRIYSEYEEVFREGLSAKIWAEYIPNFTDSEDYIIRFEPSLRVSLTSVFSLSVSYRGVFDNQPSAPGRKKYDYTYTTALIAQF